MDKLEQFDLTKINPGANIVIIGPTTYGNDLLGRTISHILSVKMSNYSGFHIYGSSNVLSKSVHFSYMHNNQVQSFKITTLYETAWASIHYNPHDLIFVHSLFMHKEFIMKKYNITNGIINNSLPHNFFVLETEKARVCKAEINTTYMEIYKENEFCHNNITKLMENIRFNYSLFHGSNGELYKTLRTRLKEFELIYYSIFCFNNKNIWIPNELNLEIINLFCLSYFIKK